jgi:acetoacetyl-CoA synthetase
MWQPDEARIEKARVTAFRLLVNERFGLDLADWPALYEWSVEEPAQFWEGMWRFADIRASKSWDELVRDRNRMPGARWFSGARLNFAENLLRHRDTHEAIVFRGEDGRTKRLTFAGLHHVVARLSHGLRSFGIKPGDRVAGYLPNIPETIIAMLAAASLGAVWSSCSPDFGVSGVLDRFGQIQPRILFATDGYLYGGRRHDTLARVRDLLPGLPSIEKVVVVPFTDPKPDLGGLDRGVLLSDFLGPESVEDIDFSQLPFDFPLYIMYSSGTTGLPKCMVHSTGGTLIQHMKEHLLHCDFTRDDRVFYFTTCGWMMWNWLVSTLATGATVMLYDGAPFHPPEVLWDYTAEEGITCFGTSAKYISAMEKEGLEPAKTHDLSALNSILSTGSPLAPESFDYVYHNVKPNLRLSSISGGTDIISCFALGSPVLPVIRGELQCRGLGMDVKVFNDAGESVTGEKGELVCTAAFPSMPTAFWNDADGSKYNNAYFTRYSNVWAHGDYAELTKNGGMVIHGRSDAVLNPGGVRIGTAEIYRVVERFDEVKESIVVGQDWKGDVRVILFVVLAENAALTEELKDRIRRAIREEKSPRHVPAKILAMAAIPRTISGKIVELAVREVIHGRPVKNTDALANPEALELYKGLAELEED